MIDDIPTPLELLDLIGNDAPAPAAPIAPVEGDDLPAKFQRNTRLAIDASAEILAIRPNPHSENYGVELRAVGAASAAQINAQLKADETAVKGRRDNSDVMEMIFERIAAARKRLGREVADDPDDDKRRIAPPTIDGE